MLQPLRRAAQTRRVGLDFRGVSKAYNGDLQMVDSSSVRAHQHADKVKKGARTKRRPPLGTSLQSDAWGAREAD